MHTLTNNFGKLAMFILRRDRIRISVWIFAITLITVVIPPAFDEMYHTQQERQVMAFTMENPAMVAMIGPVYGVDNYTVGAMNGNMMTLFMAITAGIMNIFLVVRHTRKDEESGRIEVIRSLPAGRLSNLLATLLVSLFVNVVLAFVNGIGLSLLRIDGMELGSCMLFGAILGVTGFLFAAVTALFTQLSPSARGAQGYTFAFLGLAYLVRASGDVGNETLSLISPLGLILRTKVFVEDIWYPVFIVLLISAVFILVALYLNAKRDLGEGLIPARPGRKTASVFLSNSLGLSMKLLASTLIGWILCVFIIGAAYGSVLGDLEGFLENNEILQQVLAGNNDYTMTEQFITMLMSIMTMMGTIPVLMVVLKIRAEEKKNRLEHLAARAVSKNEILSGYFGISFVLSIVVQLASVFGLWFAGTVVMDTPISFLNLMKSALAYLPAMWMMVGVAVLLNGIFPKGTGFVWIYLGYSFLAVYLGKILQFPEWMSRITPFGNIPQIPVEEFTMVPLVVLTIVALLLTLAGFAGFRQRDLEG